MEIKKSTIFSKIVVILFYGSRSIKKNINNNFSDYDLHLVLKKEDLNDLIILKRIFKKYKQDLLDISVHYYDEVIKGSKIIFQNGTQGIYFIKVLANATVLIGDNIYKKIEKKLDKKEITQSLVSKIREYTWRIRSLSLKQLTSRRSREIIKCFIKILLDIMLVRSQIRWEDLQNINRGKTIKLFMRLNLLICKNHENFLNKLKTKDSLKRGDLSVIIEIMNSLKEYGG